MKKLFNRVIRPAAAVFSLVMLAFFALPMPMHIINPGNLAGIVLSAWLFCVSVKPIHRRLRGFFKRRFFTRLIYRVFHIGMVVFLVYGIAVTGVMAFAANAAPADDAVLVTFGAEVRPSGNPSRILRGRINAAEKYLEAHPNAAAVLSGGQGNDEPFSEAECMYQVMLSDGVSADRLFTENQSTTTYENLQFSKKVIEENKLSESENIVIATDGFHQLRARMIAKSMGFKGSVGAASSNTELYFVPTYVVREWFALPYEALKLILSINKNL